MGVSHPSHFQSKGHPFAAVFDWQLSFCSDLGSEVRHGYDMATSRNAPNKNLKVLGYSKLIWGWLCIWLCLRQHSSPSPLSRPMRKTCAIDMVIAVDQFRLLQSSMISQDLRFLPTFPFCIFQCLEGCMVVRYGITFLLKSSSFNLGSEPTA